jgi:hypothetical protein
MITVYENAGLYSAATAAGILFYALPRPEAERRLIESGFPPSLLDSPVDGLTWRSVLTSAFASEIESISTEVESLAGASEDAVANLTQRLEVVRKGQRRLRRQLSATGAAVSVERQSRLAREREDNIDARMRAHNALALPGDKLPRWFFERQAQ